MIKSIPLLVWTNSMETETTTWSDFPSGGKTNVEKTLGFENRNVQTKKQHFENHSQGTE